MLGYGQRHETVNLGSSVFSARKPTLGCRHIKCLRYWVCQHSYHLRDGLSSTLVPQHVFLSSTFAFVPTMILTDEASSICLKKEVAWHCLNKHLHYRLLTHMESYRVTVRLV